MVDEAHALGAVGADGRGAVADAGLDGEVDVVSGSLGTALGSYGGYACCDALTARHLVQAARPLATSTGLPPAAAAAALAALDLLEEQPRRVQRLQDNAGALRDELAEVGFAVPETGTHIVPVPVGDATQTARIAEAALEQGVFVHAVRPPAVPEGTSRLRLAVMATHTRAELRAAARVLARAALQAGHRPAAAPFDGAASLPRAA
jgi:glycine C-acetyltransferase/8-amino-7-oxononanoate synthase